MISDRKNRAMSLLAIIISCCVLDPFSTVSSVNGIVFRMIGL